jgi:hypothetical protein
MDSAESKTPSASGTSGKLVIIGIVTIAIWAAAISWYFRYNATHRAAKFWGPETAVLIRDAPQVTLFKQLPAVQGNADHSTIDISSAGGLLHLRNALLEDHSFIWTTPEDPPNPAADIRYWWLQFNNTKTGKTAMIWLTKDCNQAAKYISLPNERADELAPISTEPMAKGLREMFAEFTSASSAESGDKPQAAKKAPMPAR